MTEMLGPSQRRIKNKYETLELWLKLEGFDANVLLQGLKYYLGHSRGLPYRGGEENDHKMPLKYTFYFGGPIRRF
jgi:hypothetical protein